jgi:hypothetical protein
MSRSSLSRCRGGPESSTPQSETCQIPSWPEPPGRPVTTGIDAGQRQIRSPSTGPALPKIWCRLSVGAGVLSIIGAVVRLLAPQWIYGRETSPLADAPLRRT